MIKISFSGLDFFPATAFTDVTNVDYRMIPIDDHVTQSSVNWNGETKVVQSLFYDAYKLTFLVKEEKKNGFQKIAYAPTITVTNTDTSEVINAKYISVEFNKISDNLEFYLCVFSFANDDSKKVQNNYNNDSTYFINFEDSPGSTDTQFTTDFEPLTGYDFSASVKSDFKDYISDYNKSRKKLSVLLFVPEVDISDFFLSLKEVAIPTPKYKIKVNTLAVTFGIFGQVQLVSNELFGEGLYKIELDLVFSTIITANYN
jgi:hypothetical protein